MYGAGVGVTLVAGSVAITPRWHILARVPFVSVIGFAGFGVANLYFTKQAIGGLLEDSSTESGCSLCICPSMRRFQPCVDDFACKQVMERDFGGATMLEWMAACRRRTAQREAMGWSSGDNDDGGGGGEGTAGDPWGSAEGR